MVVVMIVAFMVAWTPYATFAILVTIHPTIEIDPRLASIPAFFSKTAAVYNPVIYVFMNKQVTAAIIPQVSLVLHVFVWGDTSHSTIEGFVFYFCGCQTFACLSIIDGAGIKAMSNLESKIVHS